MFILFLFLPWNGLHLGTLKWGQSYSNAGISILTKFFTLSLGLGYRLSFLSTNSCEVLKRRSCCCKDRLADVGACCIFQVSLRQSERFGWADRLPASTRSKREPAKGALGEKVSLLFPCLFSASQQILIIASFSIPGATFSTLLWLCLCRGR